MKCGKTVIIGIDGVPFSLMNRFSGEGVMPYFRDLRDEGIFREMESSIPDISSVSWSSIITGRNPGEHGVFGFTEMIEGTYTLRFPDFRSLKWPPFWQTNEGRHVILNTPFTYPAQKLNGVLVSGFVAPELEGAVYPSTHLPKLKEMGYRIDVDSRKGHLSKTLLFKELFQTLDTRIRAYRHFWDSVNWDTFMLVFTGSDRVGHFLWDAYEDPEHEHHGDFLEFFRRIDLAIGEINSRLGPGDNLFILSDHGMERIKSIVNINSVLVEEGFLRLGENPRGRYNNIESGTVAFALDAGRVYLNRKGKYPRGAVDKQDEETILDGITAVLKRARAVRDVHRKEHIYQGTHLGNAPDIVVTAKPGFNLRGTLPLSESGDGLTGKHNPNAFLFVKGEKDIPENPSVEDVVGIMGGVK